MSAHARHPPFPAALPQELAWWPAGTVLAALLACWSGMAAADEPGTLQSEVAAVRGHIVPSAAPAPWQTHARAADELAGVSYRLWMSRGRAGFGLGLGTMGRLVPPPGMGAADAPHTLVGSVPMVSLGLRLRVTPESALYADASSARGMAIDSGADLYNAKLGMEWKPRKSRFGLEKGSLGIHFDSGYRVSLRARHGGLGVVLRSQF